MWTKPVQSGGVVGGNNFAVPGVTYFEGSAYNQRFANPIVLNGKLYYTEPRSFTGTPNNSFGTTGPIGPTDCIDLQTGSILWSRTDVPALSFGYIYDLYDPNQHGVYPAILFTANFARAFDADTGDALFNVTGAPTGTAAMGPSGEILRYVLANAGTTASPDWRLGEWNSSKLWIYTGTNPTISYTAAVDGSVSNPTNSSCRYDWNVSIPWRNTMSGSPTVVDAFYNNVLICYNGSLPTVSSQGLHTYFAVDINAFHPSLGQVLWWNSVAPLPGNITINAGGADPTVGVFVEATKETMQWIGYSMTTGQKLWGPTPSQTAFDYYGNTGVANIQGCLAYGKLYSCQFGGILYCYDLLTGKLLWTYGNGGEGNSTNSGFYTAYGDYPTFITAIGNGVIYTITSEHTATNPIYKGALARAVNATDGTEIWTLSDYTSYLAGPSSSPVSYTIADGFSTFFNGFDNQIYNVGRGPSSTTVSAPQTAITAGDKVVIQGTVMDVSAGTQQTQQKGDFPNGLPVASDASMKDWMGYVYQQKPEPTNFTGVKVSIDAIDPNGNYIHLGDATSNANGLYHYTWATPNIPGDYLITASFIGTNGYWPSNAQTAMSVQSAPSAAAAPTPTPRSVADMYFVPSVVAIIIVIIIVGAVLALLMLRKHP